MAATNTLLTNTKITRKSAMMLTNMLNFTMKVSRPLEDEWNTGGYKDGATISLRKPPRYTVRTGATFSAQNTTETKVGLTLSQFGVDSDASSADLTYSIDRYAERILKPKMATLANYIDYIGLGQYIHVANSIGTVGTAPSTANDLLTAGALLSNNGAPRDGERYCVLNPDAMAAMVDGTKGLLAPQGKIGDQYTRGVMGVNVLGFGEISEDQNVNVHTTGTATNAYLAAATVADGEDSIDVDTGTGTFTVGDVITFASCNDVNPQNRASTGRLKQFVVDTASAGGTVTLSMDPLAFGGNSTNLQDGGAFQNVDAHVQDTAVSYIAGCSEALSGVSGGASGTANTSPQNLAFHRNAFMFASLPLVSVKGVHEDTFATDPASGVVMRMIRDYDSVNDLILCRYDILFGFATPYGELAVRIWG